MNWLAMPFSMLARFLRGVCALIFAALLMAVLWGVFTRQVLGDQPAWTEELARFLLVWLALLGGVLAYLEDKHLGVDVLVARFHPSAQKVSRITIHVCVLGFALAVLVWGGSDLFRLRWELGQTMPSLGIRKAWFYLILPLSGILISLVAVAKIATPRHPRSGEEAAR